MFAINKTVVNHAESQTIYFEQFLLKLYTCILANTINVVKNYLLKTLAKGQNMFLVLSQPEFKLE